MKVNTQLCVLCIW